uniref:Uncharacterized protein n=1 Tax=Meloidogyne enterolobii TaxID=390850 RepID=A0A6V7V235_MELEN|nr:unnamed protein product [Meloidogyne enterolobii]
MFIPPLLRPSITILLLTIFITTFTSAKDQTRVKRQGGATVLTKAWNEALPGVPPFWDKYSSGPYGIVIRGWQFSRCASEQWTNYVVNVSNIVIWPDYPRFPGPIFFNVTMDVNEDLPIDKIEMDLERED